VAEIKLKANKAKDAGVSSFQNTRDRYQSVPMAKSKFDPHGTNPHDPSPRSSLSNSDSPSAPPPPPAPRQFRPKVAGKPPAPSLPQRGVGARGVDSETKVDWANLSAEDKEAFFSWLDEYFSRMLGIEIKPANQTRYNQSRSPPPIKHSVYPSASIRRNAPDSPPQSAPAPLTPPRVPAASPSLGPPVGSFHSTGRNKS
jgi:hypothetical protein